MHTATKMVIATMAPISTTDNSYSLTEEFGHNSLRDYNVCGMVLFEAEQQYETQACQFPEWIVSFKGGEKQEANEQETWSKVKRHRFEV